MAEIKTSTKIHINLRHANQRQNIIIKANILINELLMSRGYT